MMADKLTDYEINNYANVTTVMITANSNRVMQTSDQWNEFSSEVDLLLSDGLFGDNPDAEKASSYVFGAYPFVQRVVAKKFGLEVGEKQHRGHFHLLVEISHLVQKYNIGKFRLRFQSFLNTNYGASKGITNWNVYTRLTKDAAINYANKTSRWAANETLASELKGTQGQKELTRLEDPRRMSVARDGKTKVLQGNEDIVDSKGVRKYNKS
jgi:hypothetical protein